MKKRNLPLILLILFIGVFIGSMIGELLSRMFGDTLIKKIFFESVLIGIKEPFKVDMFFFYIIFGGGLRISFLSLLGLLIASIFAYRIK